MPRTRPNPVVEDAEFLADQGVGMYDAAPRLGRTVDALDKYLRNHQRPDLVRRLVQNNRLTRREYAS